MWILAKCAKLKGLDTIRLSDVDPPDAFCRSDGVEKPIEITEVLEPGRRRGLELKPGMPTIWSDPVENWVERATAIPNALASRLQSKKAKEYPFGTELFVYLNIDEWGIRQLEIEGEIRSQLSSSCQPFGAIYVLWKDKLFGSAGGYWQSTTEDIEVDIDDQEFWEFATRDKQDG